MRADLDERIAAVREETPDRGRELDGLAKIPHPVARIEPRPVYRRAGDGRVHRDPRRSRLDASQGTHEIVLQRIDLRAMRGHVDLHPATEHAVPPELPEQSLEV